MLKERRDLEYRIKKRGKGHWIRSREASRQPVSRESVEQSSLGGRSCGGLGLLLLGLSRGSPWE